MVIQWIITILEITVMEDKEGRTKSLEKLNRAYKTLNYTQFTGKAVQSMKVISR